MKRCLRGLPALYLVLVCLGVTRADETLPSDERIVTGKLPNGVTWLYRQHDNPPGKMAVMTHMDTGSLNETDEQRGLAHFLEHLAFNGSENFPPGQLIPYFESIGMEFGPDLNAFTSFDQTGYMLFLPDTQPEQVDKALMVLSDYAFRLLLLDDEIEKERGVILSELRAGMSAQQRIRDQLFEKLFDGMRIGQRLPIGKEEIIKTAPRAEFEKFYRAWYRPERLTLLMVGDAPAEQFRASIEKWFGQYKAGVDNPPDAKGEFKPFAQERALILSDPEYGQGDVDIYRLGPGRPPVTTVALARERLIDDIGAWIMQRRFSERIKKGEAKYTQGNAAAMSFLNEAMLVNASATGKPEDWEQVLEQLVMELNRAREYGFLDGEFELAKRELVSDAEDAVRKESTQNARRLIMQMMSAVNDKEPILSAQQELDLLQKLLPTIKVAEVSAAFAKHFTPGHFAYVLTLPQRGDVALPTETAVLAAARAAMARQVDPPADVQVATDLLDHEPTPGKVVESTTDADLGITSAWLSNGARVHHRFMDYKKDTVLVTITLAGGQIEETAANAGITQVASLALQQPATSRLASTEIQDIMTGRNISVRGGGSDDAFTISVQGSPKDLEFGLQLAHALLTDGKLEQTAFERWKQQSLQQYEMASKMPQFTAFDAWIKAVTGSDPRRPVLLTPELIEQQAVERSQAWFERLRNEAPLEVSVVGEMQLDAVMPLIEKYVGSLPERPRAAAALEPLRKFNRGEGPYTRDAELETITPQAFVISGFMSPDISALMDVRALNLAANILDSRLIKQVREEAGLVYSIGAQNRAEEAYSDSGFFMSGAPCAPDKAREVADKVRSIYDEFAKNGPTDEELANAKKQILNKLDTDMKEPRFWSGQLSNFDLHKRQLADLKDVPASYEALTADQVRSVFAKYATPQRSFRVVVVPTAGAPAAPPATAAPVPQPAGN